jgi:hypothetical protein
METSRRGYKELPVQPRDRFARRQMAEEQRQTAVRAPDAEMFFARIEL